MTRRRTLGYVENQWTCPNCGTRNRGGIRACANCGAPQPENVQFELPSEQEFVKDEKQIQEAQAGADIHCGFCGTRNPASAAVCSQCGADLKEGQARQAGRLMTAPPAAPKVIQCANCGAENAGQSSTCMQCGAALPKVPPPVTPAMSQSAVGKVTAGTPKKNNWLLTAGILALFVVCCAAGLFFFFFPSQSVEATVTDVHWQTVVPVQELQPVRYTDERGSPPSDAYDVSCHDESREVCEQKTIDKGNGYSEVVEECHTETETYCSYTVDEWTTIQTYTLEGNDLSPVYDTPSLTSDQRLGDKSEEFTVTFSTGDGIKTYSPDTLAEFQQFTIGSQWTLKLNTLGGIIGVEP